MKIKEFNVNTPRHLSAIVDSGQPGLVTWHRGKKPYVKITSADLFDELVAAAGEDGQEVLRRHRQAAERRKREEAA